MKNNNSIVFVAFLIFEASFFLPKIYTSICIALLILLLLFRITSLNFVEIIRSKNHYLVYFLVLLVGGIWSIDSDYFFSKITQNLSFILLPFIIYLFKDLSKKQIKWLKIFYIIFANVTLMICLYRAAYDFFDTGYYTLLNPDGIPDRNRFLYHEFTRYVGFHAVYFAFYLSLSLFLTFAFLMESKNKVLFIPLLVFNIIGIILCKSSIFYFITAFYFLFNVVFVWKINFFYKSFFIITIIIASYFLITLKIKSFEISTSLSEMLNSKTKIDIRFIKWYSGLSIWSDNILIGTGTGDGRNALRQYYKDIGFEAGYKYSYNAHNQYIEALVRNGILGFFSLSYLFSRYVKKVYKNKNLVGLWFAFSVIVFSLTESVFEVQRGIVFIIYFMLFFELERGTKSVISL